MKIRFGTNDNGKSPAPILGFVAFLIGYLCWYFHIRIGWSHDLILSSRLSNVTSAQVSRYCGLPYDNYSCSVLSITPNISQYCLNDTQITGVRLLPLLILILELWLIYELFSVDDQCIRFFLYALGIASVFTFAVITILVYDDSCAHLYIIGFLFVMSGILFMLTIRDMSVHDGRRRRRAADIG